LEQAISFMQEEYRKWAVNKDSETLHLEHSSEYTRQKQAQELEEILLKTVNQPHR
jgi:hypothetical protein